MNDKVQNRKITVILTQMQENVNLRNLPATLLPNDHLSYDHRFTEACQFRPEKN